MSVIPISFKADGDDSSKKGKIRAEDFSVLSSFCLPKKTGVLNVLNKCEAYNLTPSSPDTFFYLHNGYAVICGRLVYIEEASQCSITLPISGTEQGYFGIKIDLSAAEDAECSFFQKTGTLVQNDLNENPISGVYEFPLFRYTATSATVTSLTKIADIIEIAQTPALADAATYAADRGGTPDMSATIGEKFADIDSRLSALGFKRGSIGGNASGTLTKSGNYVIGTLTFSANRNFSVTIPDGFRPYAAKSTAFTLRKHESTSGSGGGYVTRYYPATITFNTNGTVTASQTNENDDTHTIMFGWDTTRA